VLKPPQLTHMPSLVSNFLANEALIILDDAGQKRMHVSRRTQVLEHSAQRVQSLLQDRQAHSFYLVFCLLFPLSLKSLSDDDS
jgi:hypothetical protein